MKLPAPGPLAYSVAGTLRILVGGGLSATVVSTSPQTASAWIAVLTGATAPLILEKVTTLVPLLVHGDKSLPVPHQTEGDSGQSWLSNGPSSPDPAVGQAAAASEGE
ncbi:hypothetical protein ACFC1L_42245 [Streptomyces sp. NPDC056210]|uniref:hypothetical protein n=1 Tax=Streptomyces sp. NPDC056210 TaxID=3345746 RepID=UPI0035E3AEC4